MPGTLRYIPAIYIHTTLATIVLLSAIRHVLTKPDPELLIQRHLQRSRCRVENDFRGGIMKSV